MGASLHLSVTPVTDSVSIADNTSAVRVLLRITTNLGTYSLDGTTRGHVALDGVQVASLDGSGVQMNTTTTLYDRCHTVPHEEDGTKTVAVTAYFSPETPGTANMTKTVTARVALPRIPRASGLTVPVLTLGSESALHIDALGDFTHTVTYRFGKAEGTVAQETAQTVLSWTPPLDLAREIPDTASGDGVLTVTTWSGGTAVGSREVPFTALVPDSLAPQVTALAVECRSDSAVLGGWGTAVKGRTKLAWSVTAQGQLGACVTGCTFSCGGASGQGTEGISGLLPQAGTFVPCVTVTDSRGKRTVLTGAAVTVHDYALPAFTQSSAFRADEGGNADGGGTFCAVSAAAQCSAVDGHNTLTLRCRYRAVDGAWSGYTSLTAGAAAVLPGFDTAVSYQVEVEALDALGGSRTVVYTVPTAAVAFHLRQGGSGAAFGKYAERDGWLESRWPVDLLGNRLAGVGQAQEEGDAVSLALLQQRLAAAQQAVEEELAAIREELGTQQPQTPSAAPEMVPGVEYATGEKWNGAAVYATVVDYGALPNGTEAENYALPAQLNVIDIRGFAVGERYNIPLPGYYAVQNLGYTRATGNLWLATTADLSGYHGYLTVKYTK